MLVYYIAAFVNGFFNSVVYEIRRPRKKGLDGSPKKPAAFYRIRTS